MKPIIQSIFFFPSVTIPRILLLVSLSLSASLFEGGGVAMLYPILDFIEKGRSFETLSATSRMWDYIGRALDFFSIPKTLLSLMTIVFCLLMVRQLFIYLKDVYGKWVSEGVLADIRSSGFRSFVAADIAFYEAHGVGEMVNALTVDGVRAGGAIFTFFNLISAFLMALAYVGLLLILSPGMTGFAMAIMVGVGAILYSRIRKSREVGREVSEYNKEISQSVLERLNGIRLVKLAAREDQEAEEVKVLSGKIRSTTFGIAKIKANMEFLVDPIVILAGLVIIYFSVDVFRMTLAKTGIFIFVLLRLLPYTKEFLRTRQGLAGLSASLFRVRDLLTEARDSLVIRGGAVKDVSPRQGIRFQAVSFSYGPGEGLALQDVSVFIPAGKMTALVGRSGAGKSTLVDLIPRLRVPTAGLLTIDDTPIADFDLVSLRRSIAFVSQEGFLFNDSIANNIRYCRPEASQEEVVAAARLAYADPFIQGLPRGYETTVGERGTKLSGGQMQRIILARALLQEASIIVLDEPTSALDSESEQYIQKAMEELRVEGHVTMIIIAHRLSTIRRADQIIVLDRGRVVEEGSHGELMHEASWYSDMVKIQSAG